MDSQEILHRIKQGESDLIKRDDLAKGFGDRVEQRSLIEVRDDGVVNVQKDPVSFFGLAERLLCPLALDSLFGFP